MATIVNPLFRRCAALLLALLLCLSSAAAEEIRYCIDFEYLRQIAPASVAWLYHPNGSINAPVVYSANDRHFLNYRFNDRWDSTGSLFFTGETPPDFTEPVLTMFGNNNANDLLFGSFYHYRQPSHYEANPTLYLITPDCTFRLDLFAGIRTTNKDQSTWRVKDSFTLLTETLPAILERSFITPLPENLPQEGDQWLVMATDKKNSTSTRYVLYARMRPVESSEDARPVDVSQLELDSRETYTTRYTVDGVGSWLIYAQNDPIWNRLIFETDGSSRKRPFGDGGCGPTAVAMAVANLVEPEELLKINDYALDPYGYTLCTCSITETFCYQYHVPLRVNTPEEMLRYYPVVLGNFITGNNTLELQGRYDRYGTGMNYLPGFLEKVYGISMVQTNDKNAAFTFLEEGQGMVVTCTGDYNSPFTRTSHYITLAGADEEYVYILDPLRREDYGDLDPDGVLEILTPGLVRMKKTDAMLIMMAPLYLMTPPGAPAPVLPTPTPEA